MPHPIDLDPPLAPPKGTFELALVLAGTVSAGAYTAGVLDYLTEALDAWYDARAAGRAAPTHDFRIKVVAGTSGGAMNAAVAAAVWQGSFPHVSLSQPSTGTDTGNPFFDAWVNQIDFKKLLGTSDLPDDKARLRSLLDCTVLDQIASSIRDTVSRTPARTRPWLPEPLRFACTLGNLCGVPYRIGFQGSNKGYDMLSHADHVRFTRYFSSAVGNQTRDDEFPLSHVTGANDSAWSDVFEVALGSGAFPVALKSRAIKHPYEFYNNRQFRPSPAGFVPISPQPLPGTKPYSFLAVDGGVMNNEPFDIAHRMLSGLSGVNPRSGKQANRAVLMVDPFPEVPAPGHSDWDSPSPCGLLGIATELFSAWKNQCRFKPESLQLAIDESIYSRFLIVPSRGDAPEWTHDYHLAGGGLGAFLGFLRHEYRLHDYMLGRRNCEWFLRRHFVLPVENPLFDSWRGDATLFERFVDFKTPVWNGTDQRHLPIIPVLAAPGQNGLPDWQRWGSPTEGMEELFEQRFNRVYNNVTGSLDLGWSGRTLSRMARSAVRNKVWKKFSEAAEKDAKERGLM